MKELGCSVIEKKESVYAIKKDNPKNMLILPYPSVGATLNAIFAVSSLNSKSKIKIVEIHNCAIEPEIDDVINFLNKIGLIVKRKDRVIKVCTLRKCKRHTVSHTPINDRIEAGSYMLAAAILRKRINIIGAPITFMNAVLNLLKDIGCVILINGNSTTINGNKINYNTCINLSTNPYPGFPTDLQPILAVLCTTLRNPSSLKDEVMPNRTDYILELNKMGATINSRNGKIEVFPTILPNIRNLVDVKSTDLRATMAIILYAIRNNIRCKIDQFHLIYRGYTNVFYKIRSIGGIVEYNDSTQIQ